jgi:membrane-bound lytic murein transglycosylase B
MFGVTMLAGMAHAAPFQQMPRFDPFKAWVQELEQEAIASGISPQTAHSALEQAMIDEHVLELDQKQPEKTATFEGYVKRVVSEARVTKGRHLLAEYAATLNAISRQYGVQPEVIVALWGVESSFGSNRGDYDVVNSLLTLAYEGRRASFFRKELLNALRILDQRTNASTELLGSWAGAMGQCQFMPSTYLNYAVDYNQDGFKNIWTDEGDIFASIANYIAAEGWRGNMPWGQEVTISGAIPVTEVGLDHPHSLHEWQAWGARSIGREKMPDQSQQASLIQPDGVGGRSFLVYDNFRALMRWNRSTYFATAVGLLADRIQP